MSEETGLLGDPSGALEILRKSAEKEVERVLELAHCGMPLAEAMAQARGEFDQARAPIIAAIAEWRALNPSAPLIVLPP